MNVFADRARAQPITSEQHRAITEIAFDLEKGSHFEDPRGAGECSFTASFFPASNVLTNGNNDAKGVFVGDFVEALLLDFESIVNNGGE